LVYIETFTVAILTAMLLQFLMQLTLKVEHIAADYFFEAKISVEENKKSK